MVAVLTRHSFHSIPFLHLSIPFHSIPSIHSIHSIPSPFPVHSIPRPPSLRAGPNPATTCRRPSCPQRFAVPAQPTAVGNIDQVAVPTDLAHQRGGRRSSPEVPADPDPAWRALPSAVDLARLAVVHRATARRGRRGQPDARGGPALAARSSNPAPRPASSTRRNLSGYLCTPIAGGWSSGRAQAHWPDRAGRWRACARAGPRSDAAGNRRPSRRDRACRDCLDARAARRVAEHCEQARSAAVDSARPRCRALDAVLRRLWLICVEVRVDHALPAAGVAAESAPRFSWSNGSDPITIAKIVLPPS